MVASAHSTLANEAANDLTGAVAQSYHRVGNFVDVIMATQYRPRVFYPRRLYGHYERQNGLERCGIGGGSSGLPEDVGMGAEQPAVQ